MSRRRGPGNPWLAEGEVRAVSEGRSALAPGRGRQDAPMRETGGIKSRAAGGIPPSVAGPGIRPGPLAVYAHGDLAVPLRGDVRMEREKRRALKSDCAAPAAALSIRG